MTLEMITTYLTLLAGSLALLLKLKQVLIDKGVIDENFSLQNHKAHHS